MKRPFLILYGLMLISFCMGYAQSLDAQLAVVDQKISARKFDEATALLNALFLDHIGSVPVQWKRVKLYRALQDGHKERLVLLHVLELVDEHSEDAVLARQRLALLERSSYSRQKQREIRLQTKPSLRLPSLQPLAPLGLTPANLPPLPSVLPNAAVIFKIKNVAVSSPVKTENHQLERKISFSLQPYLGKEAALPDVKKLRCRVIFYDGGEGHIKISQVPNAIQTIPLHDSLSLTEPNPPLELFYQVPHDFDLSGRLYIGFTVEVFQGEELLDVAGHPFSMRLIYQTLVGENGKMLNTSPSPSP